MGVDGIGRGMAPIQQTMQPVQPARQVEQTTDQNGGQQQNVDLAVNPVKNSENAGQARGGQQSGTQSGENTAAAASKEQIEQENEKIMKAISEMNKKMTSNTEAVFGIHEDTNRITIKLVDRTTKETIKELPPEKTLDMIAKAWELAGILVDERK